MKIVLGVLDQPYAGAKGGQTTGSVAQILEAKYGVMAKFVQDHEQEIADALAESVGNAIHNMMAGNAPQVDPFGAATARVEEMFRDALDNHEMDGRIPGVPTKAALRGVSHRFVNKKGPKGRSSFVDTGLYEGSFRCWVE